MASPIDDIAVNPALAILKRQRESPFSALGPESDEWSINRHGGDNFVLRLYDLLFKALERDLAESCCCDCPAQGDPESDPFAAHRRPQDGNGLPADVEVLNRPDPSQSEERKESSTDPLTRPRVDELPSGVSSRGRGPGVMPDFSGVVEVNKPIVVEAGQVFDGGNRLYRAGAALGDGSQAEGQDPVFILRHGATLRNVQIQGADGVHAYGDAVVEEVWWRDVGEDAFTLKEHGNVKMRGGGANLAADKVIQLMAGGSFDMYNFRVDGFGTAIRTNGGEEFDIDITVRDSVFYNGDQAVVRTDAQGARVAFSNVRTSGLDNEVLAPNEDGVSGTASVGYKSFSG